MNRREREKIAGELVKVAKDLIGASESEVAKKLGKALGSNWVRVKDIPRKLKVDSYFSTAGKYNFIFKGKKRVWNESKRVSDFIDYKVEDTAENLGEFTNGVDWINAGVDFEGYPYLTFNYKKLYDDDKKIKAEDVKKGMTIQPVSRRGPAFKVFYVQESAGTYWFYGEKDKSPRTRAYGHQEFYLVK